MAWQAAQRPQGAPGPAQEERGAAESAVTGGRKVEEQRRVVAADRR
jgi:hypothetical protein